MSRTQMVSVHSRYSPVADTVRRHEGGVAKAKKAALTGSGRAWREDEEAYLLQTRLQKMPYKHIAAHLNKTELACRLHYHQLSHGSTRRKRTASCSSGSSDALSCQQALAGSPVQKSKSRSLSPMQAAGGYFAIPPVGNVGGSDVQLPSIVARDSSPRLPSILPKPEPMGFSRPSESPRGYPIIMAEAAREQSLPPVSVLQPQPQPQPQQHHQQQQQQQQQQPQQGYGYSYSSGLRLDCSGLPPPSTSVHTAAHVDLGRLHSIYEAHRNAFWAAVADEYGRSTSPAALEQAWKTGICCQPRNSNPMTPVDSPDKDRVRDKTRISSILGVDMEPRVR
ncbi:beta-lactamase family protein [Purpureocillium lavendulum]|uniref:Beta-lactamase family protein n=1 Tax=Purpureocillium lavendulum TaxID=1247861 RepID=A0AB34FLC0_9HYPO|nr:beta-lactamase family protein [Purpureocillium lavendulum]